MCDWFLKCNNEPTAQVDHPTIGWVDICPRCLEWLGDNPSPTQFVPPLAAKTAKKYNLLKIYNEG